MFIRRQTINGIDYFRVIESYRERGRVKTRTVVSLGRCATLDEAIELEKSQVAFFEKNVDDGIRSNRRGRWLFQGDGFITTHLIGESAKPQLARRRALLAKLEACRDAEARWQTYRSVMLKRAQKKNTF